MSDATVVDDTTAREKRERLSRILQQRLGTPKIRPVSFSQQRLWLLDQMEPGSAFYNVPVVFPWPGELDPAALQKAVAAIVQRHEVLRTTFITHDGQPMQHIAPSLAVPVTTLDLRHLPDADQAQQLQRVLDLHARTPFELARGPLLRVLVVRRGGKWVVAMTLHHIICDGWSIDVLLRELSMTYPAAAADLPPPLPPLPPLPLQYADYAAWQRDLVSGERLRTLVDYWRLHLGGAPAMLALPLDHPRPPLQTYRGANQYFRVDAEVAARLRRIAQGESATMFMLLLAAFNILLFRYSGQRDLVVGTAIGNRVRAELEPLIGFFVNTLALRTRLAPSMPFPELLRQVRETTLGAYSHQDLPFEKLVEELQPERALSHNPLFQVMFAMQNIAGPAQEDAAPAAPRAESGTAKFDLTLSAIESGGVLSGMLEYNIDLFDAATVAQMTRHFVNLLGSIAKTPEAPVAALPMLDQNDLSTLLVDWNAASAELPGGTLHGLIAEQARRTPDAPAVVADQEQLTYGALVARAAALAERLREAGVRGGTRVAVALERSPDLIVALLGTLQAGAAYVPLDPSYPDERLRYMLADSAPAAVITTEALRPRVQTGRVPVLLVDGTVSEAEAAEDTDTVGGLAYVLYTSGSTGLPKGVCISHRAAVHHMQWLLSEFPLAAGDVVLQRTPVSFDASVWEIFAPLMAGATLALAPPDAADLAALVAAIVRHQVTTLQVVPSLLRVLLADRALARCTSLRRLFCGGEALAAELVRQARALVPVEVVNLYGPTETTIDLTYWRCGDEPVPPIGRPVSDMRVYVLDDELRPVPPGVPGQLCAAGPQLADGYHARPAATAAAFVPNPFAAAPGERLYLTGDVVRWRPGGVLEFLGRVDGQVKVRGFRIELGEIESALAAHPAVRQAAVTARPDPAGGMRLVAYTVCDDDVAAADLREWLVARLPQHMLPALIERIATLPLTPNGKVDLRALPDPLAGRAAPATRTAPETPHERALAAIWSDLLGTANVGLEDDFFDLGGHSLTATQLVSRVRTRLHVELPLRTVFEAPLLGDLARRVAALASPASAPAAEPTPLEQRICAVWREVLGRTAGIDELFPGSASQLLHVRARLAGELGAVSAAQLLAHPTIRAQALFVTTRALEARGAASADALLERAGGILSKEAL